MKEEDAKQKWCPRIADNNALASITVAILTHLYPKDAGKMANTITERMDNRCIASDCMMWKWSVIEKDEAHNLVRLSDKHGFCGLTHGTD